jgi:hypothetical protein
LVHRAAAERAENFRTPRANLEAIYGDGPVGHPFLYRRDDPAMLLIGVNDAGEEADLPRNSDGTALIGDPRNDVHIFVSQLHVAMLRLHNCVVDHLRRRATTPESAIFDEARRTVSWLYQWVIVNDYLPRLVGQELLAEPLRGGRRSPSLTVRSRGFGTESGLGAWAEALRWATSGAGSKPCANESARGACHL